MTDFYYQYLNPEKGEALAEVKKENVERLIIKDTGDRNKAIVVNFCDYLLVLKKQKKPLNEFVPNEHIAKQFEELIDACVYELYFEKEVKAKEADVLQLVAEQFKPIADLPEPQKIKVIQEGYQILRDSHNEIRNRITRQKLVEEIAIIQNSV